MTQNLEKQLEFPFMEEFSTKQHSKMSRKKKGLLIASIITALSLGTTAYYVYNELIEYNNMINFFKDIQSYFHDQGIYMR